ncbi:MAG: hypothetical protein AB7F35_16430 [Acetobacteraceae bacterium]
MPGRSGPSGSAPFFALYSQGRATADDIDDFIDEWHEDDDAQARDIPLHDYLGLSVEEYGLWVQAPDALPLILAARRDGRPLRDVVLGSLTAPDEAVGDGDPEATAALRLWLERRPAG